MRRHHPQHDLFGQVPVTLDEVRQWVEAVAPAYCSSERAFLHYVHAWQVADKVAAAKLAGTFDATIENARARRASLLQRFGF
ncbi:hypothetical protein AWB76_04088 [Caballeronia temeraria]|uniref:Uncharacterized protein n=1 Tax=Caballeronia temeraria TaxID=1777137 RepID=A0A158BG67_9BURK|nr:hypothetical protein [Caballeronia temeraria]SAK68327.1 hypothetical protein AWB76_04088 [Caballeronia temeraria]